MEDQNVLMKILRWFLKKYVNYEDVSECFELQHVVNCYEVYEIIQAIDDKQTILEWIE